MPSPSLRPYPTATATPRLATVIAFFGRTLLVANRFDEARAAALEAESLLSASAGKDYQDLQILHGDLAGPHDPQSAESFYTAVIYQCARDDARYSEIHARAYYSRARSRLAQGRRSHAKADFQAAADGRARRPRRSPIWGSLKCPRKP